MRQMLRRTGQYTAAGSDASCSFPLVTRSLVRSVYASLTGRDIRHTKNLGNQTSERRDQYLGQTTTVSAVLVEAGVVDGDLETDGLAAGWRG
jgi:hypothetical protein